MSDTRPSFDQLADAARLALARGDKDGARASLTSALRSVDEDGTVGTETSESLLRLGALYQDAGLDTEAERLFSDAVAIARTTLGEDHLGLASALSCLGTRLLARGASAEAEPLLQSALDISERQLGANHPDLNGLLNILSRLYLKEGAFSKAEPLLERLLALKRVKGEDHPEVATVLASLALVRQGVGDHEGAESLGRRVLQIREKTLAPNHYAIASALELLGDECAARGKVEEAGRHYQRALSIREQTLGVSHASLRVLRERIVDLQLQAADVAGDDTLAALVASSTLGYSMPAPPPTAAVPPLTRSPVPPWPATSAPAPSVAVAVRPGIDAVAPGRSAFRPNVETAERADESQHALELPAATGLVWLQEELEQNQDGRNEDARAQRLRERLQRGLSTLSGALSTRRAQVTIAGTAVVVLTLAALSAEPRTAESSENVPGVSRATIPGGQQRASGRLAAPADADSASAVFRTSTGSIAVRPASASPSVSVKSRDAERRSSSESSRDRGGDAPSLELSRNLRLPVAAVSIGRADSIAQASEQAPGVGQGFSKQFWTSGIDKRPVDASTGPTSARLLGTMPEPVYPVFLRKNNVEGEVVVQFVVDETGKPDLATFEVVSSPHDAMTASVRKVIEQIRFEPARTGGANPKPRTEVVRSSFLFKAGGK